MFPLDSIMYDFLFTLVLTWYDMTGFYSPFPAHPIPHSDRLVLGLHQMIQASFFGWRWGTSLSQWHYCICPSCDCTFRRNPFLITWTFHTYVIYNYSMWKVQLFVSILNIALCHSVTIESNISIILSEILYAVLWTFFSDKIAMPPAQAIDHAPASQLN